MTILSECHCSSHTSKSSFLNWLSVTPPSNSTKRYRSHKKRSFSDVEYSEMSFNMVGPSTTPSKSKGKQLAINSEESDVEPSSGLKEILIESEGIYQHTWIRINTIAPVDYSALVRVIEQAMSTLLLQNLNRPTLIWRRRPLHIWPKL